MQIGSIRLDDPALLTTVYDNHIANPSPMTELKNVRSSLFMLDPNDLAALFKDGGFREFRLKCYKPWHGRTLHLVLPEKVAYEYIVNKVSTARACNTNLRYLDDDTSAIKGHACQNIRVGWNGRNYHDHTFWVSGHQHAMVRNNERFECDDFVNYEGYDTIGYWQFYIR